MCIIHQEPGWQSSMHYNVPSQICLQSKYGELPCSRAQVSKMQPTYLFKWKRSVTVHSFFKRCKLTVLRCYMSRQIHLKSKQKFKLSFFSYMPFQSGHSCSDCKLDCRTCNYKVVGSNPTKLTADFTMTRTSNAVQLLNHNFLICAVHNHSH